jgi:folate-binding protein YgfZ
VTDGDPVRDYWQAVRGVACFSLSEYGQVDVTGPEAGRFLHNLCTNDVLKLVPGSGCEAFLTTAQAKIVGFVVISRTVTGYRIDAGPGQGTRVAAHLDRYIVSEQVEIGDRTGEFTQVHVAGVRAGALLASLLSVDVRALDDLQMVESDFRGVSCMVQHHYRLGLPGYNLICPADHGSRLQEALHQAGAGLAGSAAFEALRIEAGTPVFGVDIDESNLPQEVGRTNKAISFTKGCYIGQETVARIRTYGHVNRSLVGLKLAGALPARPGDLLSKEAAEVGKVTSSAFSPRLDQAVALAYIRRGQEEPGIALELQTAGGQLEALVAKLPLVQ